FLLHPTQRWKKLSWTAISGEVRLTSEHTEYKWVEVDRLLDYIQKPSMVKDVRSYLEWRKRNQSQL
ncbi:MAG: hypothetical protein U0401_04315, partial [Anaerolineae bacterium]